MNRFPIATLAVLALAAIASSGPHAASALVYDREKILSGEFWRMITANWVHFSKSHFAYDLLAFGLAGSLVELRGYRGFTSFSILAHVSIGPTVFLTQPNLQIFGGLSGLATGAIVLLSLHGLCQHSPWRWICLLALIGIAAKIAFEFTTGQLAFAQTEMILIKPLPESHLAGALSAIAVWRHSRVEPRTRRPRRSGRFRSRRPVSLHPRELEFPLQPSKLDKSCGTTPNVNARAS